VVFGRVDLVRAGPLRLQWPQIDSFDWRAALLATLAALLIFRLRWNLIRVLGLAAVGGLVLGQFG
jgi:chromate transporter